MPPTLPRNNLPHPHVIPAQWYRAAQLLGALPPQVQQDVIRQAQTAAWVSRWSEVVPAVEVNILGRDDSEEGQGSMPPDTEMFVMATLQTMEYRERVNDLDDAPFIYFDVS